MKRACTWVVLVGLATLTMGCGHYLGDRGNDLLDCLKLRTGFGVGVDIELQATRWIATGVGASRGTLVGLEGRDVVITEREHYGVPVMPLANWLNVKDGFPEFAEWHFGTKAAVLSVTDVHREDLYDHSEILRAIKTAEECTILTSRTASALVFNLDTIPTLRRNVRGKDPSGKEEPTLQRQPINAFDVAVGATLMPLGVKLGFSPGQFVDFVLGWTLLDIGDDDAMWVIE